RSLETERPVAREIVHLGRTYLRRVITRSGNKGGTGSLVGLSDITQQKRLADHQRVLVAELRHRVGNIVAAIRTIARETRKSVAAAGMAVDFADIFESRIAAFARAESLIVDGNLHAVDLEILIREELLAYAVRDGRNCTLHGCPVSLR